MKWFELTEFEEVSGNDDVRGIAAIDEMHQRLVFHDGEGLLLRDELVDDPALVVRPLDPTDELAELALQQRGLEYARLGRCRAARVASDGESVAVMSVVDNLTKGAAGGAVQWMNRLLGLPETTGLTFTGAGWV